MRALLDMQMADAPLHLAFRARPRRETPRRGELNCIIAQTFCRVKTRRVFFWEKTHKMNFSVSKLHFHETLPLLTRCHTACATAVQM
jgi:hypothetical protein